MKVKVRKKPVRKVELAEQAKSKEDKIYEEATKPKKGFIAGSDLRAVIEILYNHKALICNVEDRMLSDFVYGILPK